MSQLLRVIPQIGFYLEVLYLYNKIFVNNMAFKNSLLEIELKTVLLIFFVKLVYKGIKWMRSTKLRQNI